VIERIAAEQITEQIVDENAIPALQSAYRRHHSTESASLVKVLSDIFDAADFRQVPLLGLLDLSAAAFDTVDHDILLRRLATSFVISELTLKWLSSFLAGGCGLWYSEQRLR